MVDEQEPAKRVVKRVVKKTVARPTPPAEAPQIRYGRPVATSSKATAPAAKVASRGASAPPRPVGTSAPAPKAPRQRVDVRGKVVDVRGRAVDAWWFVADGVGDGGRATGRFVAARARTVAAWRLPHLHPYLATVVTGAVVGLVCVGLGISSLAIFRGVRGVSSGGGLWGGLTFAVIAIVAALLGDALLRGFGATSARLTSVLAVVLSIIAILGVFLDLADSSAAIVLVPVLGIAAFPLAHWLIDLAEHTPPVTD